MDSGWQSLVVCVLVTVVGLVTKPKPDANIWWGALRAALGILDCVKFPPRQGSGSIASLE